MRSCRINAPISPSDFEYDSIGVKKPSAIYDCDSKKTTYYGDWVRPDPVTEAEQPAGRSAKGGMIALAVALAGVAGIAIGLFLRKRTT